MKQKHKINPDATQRITFGVSIDSVLGSTSVSIEGVTSDSRALGANSLFVAIRGEHHDGHDHISDAVKRGQSLFFVKIYPKSKKIALPMYRRPNHEVLMLLSHLIITTILRPNSAL
ncbi:MAG: hypothetical protein CM15mP59_1990 [Flavobacteriaceae bacterium]|nr:MAG: hypothetical protein CM15mP59_1990 [Flavobacteriaceae bacterium]